MFAHPCPSCSQRLLAPTDRIGQRTICPKCLRPFTVPSPESLGDPKTIVDPSELPPSAVDLDTSVSVEMRTDRITHEFEESDVLLDMAKVRSDLEAMQQHRQPAMTAAAVGVADADDDGDSPLLELSALPGRVTPPVVSTHTPPPRPFHQQMALPTYTPPHARTRHTYQNDSGRVVLNPTGLLAVDIAADLGCTISMRMAPPPMPASDRLDQTLIGTAWACSTLAAVGLWVAAFLSQPNWFVFVTVLGLTLAVFGVLWRAYLAGQGGGAPAGWLTLLPPVAAVQLFRPAGAFGVRPLGVVLTGGALAMLGAFGPAISSQLDSTDRGKQEMAEPTAEQLLETINTGVTTERHRAMTSASKAPTPELAEAVAARLGDRDDRDAARRALVGMGAEGEAAAVKALASPTESVALQACEVIESVGSEAGLKALQQLAESTTSRAVRREAVTAAEVLQKKLKAAN